MHVCCARAARREIRIHREPPLERRAIVVAVDRPEQIVERLDGLISAQLHERVIEPRRRVGRIEALRELELASGQLCAMLRVVGLAHVAAHDRARWIERHGDLEMPAAGDEVAALHQREREAELR